jgi:hypothetical protein
VARNIDILWIAPGLPDGSNMQPLGWLDELGAIAEIEGITLRTVSGKTANTSAVSRALRASSAELVIWSGHGLEDGLLASDGAILSGEWIACQARAAADPPNAFLVGACYSGNRGEYMTSLTESISQAGIHAIGFTVAADDHAAAVYATELVRALVADADVAQANRIALRFAQQFSRETAAGIVVVPAMLSGYRTIIREIRSIRDGQESLCSRMGTMERRQDEMLAQLETVSRGGTSAPRKTTRGKAAAPVPA